MTKGRTPHVATLRAILLFSTALLGACGVSDGTQPITAEQVGRLEAGMASKDVKEILGNTSEKTEEHWVYRPTEGPYAKVDIFLDQNSEVTSVSTSDR